MLTKLTIKNFKRFDQAEIELGKSVVLIGPNNSGKTTALQALAPGGREAGLLAGANVIMPNITDAGHRKNYNLYVNKPDADNDLLISSITAAI